MELTSVRPWFDLLTGCNYKKKHVGNISLNIQLTLTQLKYSTKQKRLNLLSCCYKVLLSVGSVCVCNTFSIGGDSPGCGLRNECAAQVCRDPIPITLSLNWSQDSSDCCTDFCLMWFSVSHSRMKLSSPLHPQLHGRLTQSNRDIKLKEKKRAEVSIYTDSLHWLPVSDAAHLV